MKGTKTHDNSHFGVRVFVLDVVNSKDLINSDKTGLDPILVPVLNLRVFEIYNLSITFDSTYLVLFLREKVNKEVGYYCKRGPRPD